MSSALDVLGKAPLFRELVGAGLEIIAGIAVEKKVPAGSPLFVENMVGESLFVVKSGTVKITRRTARGEEELGALGPLEHLGGLALLGSSVRLVSAVAVTECEVLEISQRDFARLQPQKPQACLRLALAIAGDLARKAGESRDLLHEIGARAREAAVPPGGS